MKKLSICSLLIVNLLLQSCYSYRKIDISKNIVSGKIYKIKQFDKYEKVKFISSTDSTITVSNNKEVENTVPKKDIKIIKKRHFSVLKTVLLPIGIGVVGVTAILATGGGNFIDMSGSK